MAERESTRPPFYSQLSADEMKANLLSMGKVRSTNVQRKTAQYLLQTGCVEIRPDRPFVFTTGLISPAYSDTRKEQSFVKARTYITRQLARKVRESDVPVYGLAAVAQGGIYLAAIAADHLKIPMITIRDKAKDHGTGKQIDGVVTPNQEYWIIEDHTTTSKSLLEAVRAVREAGGVVTRASSVMTWGFPEIYQMTADNGIDYESMTNVHVILYQATRLGLLDNRQLASAQEWWLDPKNWAAKHGFTKTSP